MDEAVGLIWEYQQTKDNEIATVLIRKYEPMVKMAAGKISVTVRTYTRIYIRPVRWL